MVINESTQYLNELIPLDISNNCTILIFTQNSNFPQIFEPTLFNQILPIITLIIGALLTFFINLFSEKLKEIKEIRRYEYVLIDDILDISEEENKCDLMVEYFNSQKKDPRFVKIKNYKIISDYILKVIQGENPDQSELRSIYKKLLKKI